MPKHIVSDQKRDFAKGLRGKQTAPEVLLWRELRDRRLAGWKFRRQVPVEGYVVDFISFEARLIVEVDGPLHREDVQRAKDKERDTILSRNGFRTLRFDAEIGPGRMVDTIRDFLKVPLTHPSRKREGHPLPQGERGAPVRSDR